MKIKKELHRTFWSCLLALTMVLCSFISYGTASPDLPDFQGETEKVIESDKITGPDRISASGRSGNNRAGESWDGTAAGQFAGGSGTQADPYHISNGAELAYLAHMTNQGNAFEDTCFQLTQDIDLADMSWVPAGTRKNGFAGCFDGDGHTIYGLFIESEESHKGLFGYLAEDAVVKNLKISDANVSGGDFTGALAGAMGNGACVENCSVNAVVQGKRNVGGLVGQSSGIVTDSKFYGSALGLVSVGGIAGIGYSFENVRNHGEVCSLSSHAGGIAGELSGSAINAGNTGTVVAKGSFGGGLAGYAFNRSWVFASYNSGSVQAADYAGGLAGYAESFTVRDSYNSGDTDSSYVAGGLVGSGRRVTVTDSYNTGNVSTVIYGGGLMGSAADGSEIINSYTIGSLAGNTCGAVTGRVVTGGLSLENCYYEQGISENAIGNGTATGTAVILSETEMKGAHEKLGESFREDFTVNPVNSGYPILKEINYGVTDPEEPGDGSGTEEDPYIVESAEELLSMAENPDAYYRLSEDIDISEINWNPGEEFRGGLDGGGHKISGLELDTEESDQGLFSSLNGAIIQNLVLGDILIAGDYAAGSLAGYAVGTTVENCRVESSLLSGSENIGGLLGEAYDCTIRNVTVNSNVSGDYLVGGIVGYSGNTVIEAAVFSGTVSCISDSSGAVIGGIAGARVGGSIEKSCVLGNVQGGSNPGGLVGMDRSGSDGFIRDCYVTANVTGSGPGGLVGRSAALSGRLIVENCYFAGVLLNDESEPIEPMLDNLLPSGSINCYFDLTKNPNVIPGQQTYGRSTVQMMQRATYEGWDFESIWEIEENVSYPLLQQSLFR